MSILDAFNKQKNKKYIRETTLKYIDQTTLLMSPSGCVMTKQEWINNHESEYDKLKHILIEVEIDQYGNFVKIL
jgi:hypothetical protein